MNEHLMFAINTSGTYPAWTTPDKAIPVISCNLAGKRALVRHEDTGATTKARQYKSRGAVAAQGQIQMYLYPEYLIPWAFRSFLTNAAQAAAGTGWDNDLLPDDTVTQLPWFSFQKKYSSSIAENARGGVLQRMSISARGGEMAQATLNFILSDVARAGQNWSDDSTASEAVISSVPYPATIPTPLRFHEGSIIIGGTPSLSTNKITVSGGTTVGTIENFTLDINLNTEGRLAVRDGDPTIAYTRHGEREIIFTGEIDWADLSATYYDDMAAANEACVQLKFSSDAEFVSGQNYELFMTLPRMVWPEDGAPFPQLDGTFAPKRQALRLIALAHASLSGNPDIGVSIQTPDDLVP